MARIAGSLPVGPTTDAEISTFEKYIGHELPTDYRRFLLQHNGGRPEPDAFLLRTGDGEEENVVLCFFPMRDLKLGSLDVEDIEGLRTWPLQCAWDGLQGDLEDLHSEAGITEALLPIGTDGSSNYFCIVLGGGRAHSVVFFAHDGGEPPLLAGSFTGFLESLRRRERTDYASDDADE